MSHVIELTPCIVGGSIDELGRYLSPASAGTITYMEAMATPLQSLTVAEDQGGCGPVALVTQNDAAASCDPDSRCILCDSYLSGHAEPPSGIDIHGYRLPSTQETLSEKLAGVLHPLCGVSLDEATAVWQMKHICMACSAALMTLDSYETKILEMREEVKQRFQDVVEMRAPHYGPVQEFKLQAQLESSPPSNEAAGVPQETSPVMVVVDEVGNPAGDASLVLGAPPADVSSVVDSAAAGDGCGVSGGDDFTCHVCHKSFRNKFNLKRHSSMHTGVRPFSCDHCSRTFRQKDHLRTHTRAGPGDALPSCHLCGLVFACFTRLVEHKRRLHQELGENGCRHCDQVFSTPTELRRHSRQAHPKPVRAQFGCQVCGRAFPNGYNLRRHERTHSGERPYVCEVCGKQFTQLGILKKHELVHQKKLPTVRELINSI